MTATASTSPATTNAAMSLADYMGFASMVLLLIGAVNWGVVAIRYTMNSMYTDTVMAAINGSVATLSGASPVDDKMVFEQIQIPDLLELLSSSARVQLLVYYTVFVSGLFYLGLFVYNSMEMKMSD